MGCICSKKNVPPFDPRLPVCYQELNKTFDNDKDFIYNLVKQGNEEFLKSIESMLETVSTQGLVNLDSLKLHCHSIKGSAATITCFRLSDMAKNLEEILDNQTNSKIVIKHLNFMKTEITEILNTKQK